MPDDRDAEQEAREIIGAFADGAHWTLLDKLGSAIAAALQRRDDELARLREDNKRWQEERRAIALGSATHLWRNTADKALADLKALKTQHEVADKRIWEGLERETAHMKDKDALRDQLAEAQREIERLRWQKDAAKTDLVFAREKIERLRTSFSHQAMTGLLAERDNFRKSTDDLQGLVDRLIERAEQAEAQAAALREAARETLAAYEVETADGVSCGACGGAGLVHVSVCPLLALIEALATPPAPEGEEGRG